MGVRIVGLAVAVPKNTSSTEDLVEKFGYDIALKIQNATGVIVRHVVSGDTKTLELALESANEVLMKTGISASQLDAVILVTQTPEYKLPATACIIQDRLGIPKNAMAFDMNLGCSGYPYGIIMASSMIESGLLERVLLIIGDITSSTAAPLDQSTFPLFADAFSATIIERCSGRGDLLGLNYGTDGSGWRNIINPIGNIRYKDVKTYNESNSKEVFPEIKYPEYTYMDGNEVFIFCLKTLPKMIMDALRNSSLNKDDIDYFIFHQANLFILKHIAKKLNIADEKVPTSLDNYGNTSSASIPVTACDFFSKHDMTQPVKVAMVGFGVGYSWATVIMRIDPAVVFKIKEV